MTIRSSGPLDLLGCAGVVEVCEPCFVAARDAAASVAATVAGLEDPVVPIVVRFADVVGVVAANARERPLLPRDVREDDGVPPAADELPTDGAPDAEVAAPAADVWLVDKIGRELTGGRTVGVLMGGTDGVGTEGVVRLGVLTVGVLIGPTVTDGTVTDGTETVGTDTVGADTVGTDTVGRPPTAGALPNAAPAESATETAIAAHAARTISRYRFIWLSISVRRTRGARGSYRMHRHRWGFS